jgi:nucleoside-diphosphate-sugar epimerase
MNILVTGGAGFVGSLLVREMLLNGNSVRVLDNLMYTEDSIIPYYGADNFQFIHGDIRDKDLCQKAMESIDAVVHLAAIVGDPAARKSPEFTREVNVDGSQNIIGLAQENNVEKLIFASTCSNYGKSDVSTLADEATNLNPVSLYAETKVEVEQHLIQNTQELNWTILRFATVYGVSPRMRFDLTVNDFTMTMMTTGQLTVYGEQFWRPYVHLKDVARAIMLVLSRPDVTKREIFNTGNTLQNFQKIDIVRSIQKLVPSADIEFVHKDEDPRDYRVSFEKISEQLGYQTLYKIEDGISEVYHMVKSGIIKDFHNPEYSNS